MRKNIEEIKNDIKELKDLKGLIEKLALSVDEKKAKFKIALFPFSLLEK